ncbi:ankyrin repeat and SOCS box protein 3-like [Papaver somniferum]|uniref:ankyrin repeat and SOCS box protein 3-like n=1 Tax=Papaver somniferum TaxID=3469 RepID=UPI000E6F6236|nr:ankyrin repeat and SOCS box protein 3-like [Papaver somniferum]
MKGHKDVLSLFLSKGSNVDVKNDFVSPLRYAATFGDHDTVKILLDHGANPNFFFHDTFTPLHASIYPHSWKCVELLLKAGADPNGGPDGFKALPFAAGKVQIIKLLVEAGADPNVTDILVWVSLLKYLFSKNWK